MPRSLNTLLQQGLPRTQLLSKILLLAALFACIGLHPPLSHAQGCTQCRDNTAATPPTTQRAYRHAIILMTLTAGGLFAATLAVARRNR